MKKVLPVLMALAMTAAALTGCAKNGGETAAETTTAAATETAAETTEEQLLKRKQGRKAPVLRLLTLRSVSVP